MHIHIKTLHMKRLIIPTAMAIILVACGTSKIILSQADVDRGAQKFPGLTLAELNQGKTDAEMYCSKCHQYKKPKSRTEEQWREIVPRMAKMKNSEIDTKTEQSILRYLVTMSKNW